MNRIRPPAVAGAFYPASPALLNQEVGRLLAAIPESEPASAGAPPKALIVPHAGYVYSGQTAAQAYALLRPYADTIRRVVLLGPTHRVAVNGLALPAAQSFATPLGHIEIDQDAVAALAPLPQIVVSDAAHAAEHALEVQLPYLQKILPNFKLVPLAVGNARAQDVAEVIDRLWGGPETLIVVSSDLSHFHTYAQARQRDEQTVAAILAGQLLTSYEQACGAGPINGLLLAARAHQLNGHLIALCNSGDTAGDRARVVGYAAFAFTANAQPSRHPKASTDCALTEAQGQTLPAIARAHIHASLGQPAPEIPGEPWLDNPGAVFVTLKKQGALRGCIGSLQPHQPLRTDLKANALSAAFRDPRFPPVAVEELAELNIEVSVIGPSQPIAFHRETDALAQITPGIDGIILEYGQHRATFLPQVWEQLPDRRQFMAHLKAKAGLPADFWSADLRLARYQVSQWCEPESVNPPEPPEPPHDD